MLRRYPILIFILSFTLLSFSADFCFALADPCHTLFMITSPFLNSTRVDQFLVTLEKNAELKVGSYSFNYKGLPEESVIFDEAGSVNEKACYSYLKDWSGGDLKKSDQNGAQGKSARIILDPGQKRIASEIYYGQSGKIEKVIRNKFDGSGIGLLETAIFDSEMNCLEKISISRAATGKISEVKFIKENISAAETWFFQYRGSSCEVSVKNADSVLICKYVADYDAKGRLTGFLHLTPEGGTLKKYRLVYSDASLQKKPSFGKNVSLVEDEPEGYSSMPMMKGKNEKMAKIIATRLKLARVFNNPKSTPEQMAKAMRDCAAANNDEDSIKACDFFESKISTVTGKQSGKEKKK